MRIRQHLRFIVLTLALGLLVGPSHASFTPKVMAAPSLETSSTFRLFHPVFVKDFDFVSTLHLYNGNSTELPMTLTILNQWGGPVLTTDHTLAAHSHFSLSSNELLALPTGSYAIIAASSAPFSSVMRSLNPDRGQLSLYRGLQESKAAFTLHFGPFFATAAQTSELLLTSIGTATTILTATYYDINGDLVATHSEVIAPGGSLIIDTNQLTLPVGFVGRVKVTSSFGQPLLGLLRTTNVAGNLIYQPPIATGASVQQSTAEAAYQHFYPRVLRSYGENGGPQTTTLFLSNLATVASAATINYANSNGMFELPTLQSLPAGGGALIPITNGGLPNGIWSAIISSSQPIATAELTEYEGLSDFASAAYGSDMDTEITLPYVARATMAHTIFSVQNVGTADTGVQISYYGQGATPLLHQSVTIRPAAAVRLDPRTIGQLPLTFEGSVVMTATQPLVAWVDEYVRVKQTVPIQNVTVTGPTIGVINQPYNFTAAIAPVTATVPITYTWYPNEPSLSESFSQTGGITNVATLTWPSGGHKAVRVVAANAQGTVTSVAHQINLISEASFSCSTVTEISQSECEALVALYNTTNGPNWLNKSGWLSINTPCSWYGIHCSSGHVDEIRLSNNNLTGVLPPEIGDFVGADEIYLSDNHLQGAIPPEIGNLYRDLNILHLANNHLSGVIPPEIGNLKYLESLYLYNNELSGPIPPEIGKLKELWGLYLYKNKLSGALPPELADLDSLEQLSLSSNQFSGTIPEDLGHLRNLLLLNIGNNRLTGSIPSELGNLQNLQLLYLQSNQLSGTIPIELGNLTNLQDLSLSNNALIGLIPDKLGNLQNLNLLYLSANQLRGPIPDAFGNLHNLTRLSLYTNQLSGEIPAALGNLTKLTELTLYDNRLTGNIPPELGALVNLNWLTLAENQLTGELPSQLANLVNLIGLNVSDNAFHGPLPSALTQLTNLSSLFFYSTDLCEPTDAAVQSWLGKLQWVKGTGLPCGATPGGLTGTVTNPGGHPLANIQVSLYRNLSNNLWQRMASTTTDAQGRYTMGGLGQVGYQLFFADPTGQYGDEYYNDAGTLATATTITPTLGTTLTVDAQLAAPVLPAATVESTTAGVTTDTRTGEVNITMARPHKSDLTISRTATCEGGALPTAVELVMVQAGVTLTYTMQATATPDTYQVTIPQADMTTNATLRVQVICANASSDITIGTLQLYDPSGLVTDSASGLPIIDAWVTLYHVPGWHARLDANDTATNTCESNLSKAASAPWSQAAPISVGVLFNPDTDTANPDVSTMRTNHLGQYGWDVPAGCWYVVVTAAGYETKVSPVVGVPPAVTDLHVALTKNSTATPTPTSTVTPTPTPTVTPTPPTQTPVPTPTPGDLPNNELPRVYLPLVAR